MKISQMEVVYVDHMGSDNRVADAARVSFSKSSENYTDEQNARLINYLAEHNHWSPLAHPHVTLYVKAPIFVARQLVKHQVGLVWNEVSRRYVDSPPEFWFPKEWRGRPEGSMKQGSSGVVEGAEWCLEFDLLDGYRNDCVSMCLEAYSKLLERGVAPEQARMILPQNMMTEWIWTGSLMAFARVCKQRLDPHAQAETREVAEGIDKICAGLFPVSWEALK